MSADPGTRGTVVLIANIALVGVGVGWVLAVTRRGKSVVRRATDYVRRLTGRTRLSPVFSTLASPAPMLPPAKPSDEDRRRLFHLAAAFGDRGPLPVVADGDDSDTVKWSTRASLVAEPDPFAAARTPLFDATRVEIWAAGGHTGTTTAIQPFRDEGGHL